MPDDKNIIIYRTADGRALVALYAKDGRIWLGRPRRCQGSGRVGKTDFRKE